MARVDVGFIQARPGDRFLASERRRSSAASVVPHFTFAGGEALHSTQQSIGMAWLEQHLRVCVKLASTMQSIFIRSLLPNHAKESKLHPRHLGTAIAFDVESRNRHPPETEPEP